LKGEQPERFKVEFPTGVLAQRSAEIQSLVSSEFDALFESQLRAALEAQPNLVRKAYTVSSDKDVRLFAQFWWSQRAGVAPALKYWEVKAPPAGAPVDVPALVRLLEAKTPTLTIDNIAVSNPKAIRASQPNTFLTQLVYTIAPWLLILGLFWFFLFRQMRSPGGGGGVLSFGRSRAQLITKEKSNVTFDDVAGIDEAKDEVQEIIEFLKNPAKFSRLGGRIPRGVLLVGPPGTGKTLLAKAIAGEANVPFFSISGSDFVEMFVGVGASRVRDLFRQARENSPCLIFLDEIDAVGRKRGSGMGGGHDEREQTLNAILVEMDGFETDEGIILVAATNRPDVLDPALLRPGRFDRQIVVGLPDLKGREAILRVHTKKVKMSPTVEIQWLARATPGFSGAELAAIVNEAALIATLKNKEFVERSDFEEARDKVRFGRQKKNKVMDEKDRKETAYHETGHALVAHFLEGMEPLHKVTIIPRGMSLGATMVLPQQDRFNEKKKELLNYIAFAYGGRCAEELFCDDISTGAYDDIKRATEIARQMVCQWGMSENIGPISYADSGETMFLGQEIGHSKTYSEAKALEIDREIQRILTSGYETAKQILSSHREHVERITDALIKYETLTGAEVRAIVEGKNIDDLKREETARERAEDEARKREAAKTEAAKPREDDGLGIAQPRTA
jgi:cell division protease FtsH